MSKTQSEVYSSHRAQTYAPGVWIAALLKVEPALRSRALCTVWDMARTSQGASETVAADARPVRVYTVVRWAGLGLVCLIPFAIRIDETRVCNVIC